MVVKTCVDVYISKKNFCFSSFITLCAAGVHPHPRARHIHGHEAVQQGEYSCFTTVKQQLTLFLTLLLSPTRTIWINSPKASTGSPERIPHLEYILTQRARKPSSQAWGSCIWKFTHRWVVT